MTLPDRKWYNNKIEWLSMVFYNTEMDNVGKERGKMKRARRRGSKAKAAVQTQNTSVGRKGKKKLNRFAIFCISLVSILVMSAAVLAISSLFDKPDDSEGYVQPVEKETGKVNVLVLGVDKKGLLTDTMIIASYNLDENTMRLLSIPRDTRMYVGTHYQKINAAYATAENKKKDSGAQGSVEAVSRLTGIPINYYVKFSTTALRDLVDALGGIEFDVPQRMKYSDPAQNLYINLQPGLQMLDGDKAEQLVRFRQYPNGDIDRVNMQQNFIQAIIEQKLNAGIITKAGDLYKAVQKNIETNADLSDLMRYVPNLLELSTENITMFQVPGRFSEKSEYDASYWLPNMTELRTLVETEFGYDASKITTGKPGTIESGSPEKTKTPATEKPTKTERPDEDEDDEETQAPKKTKTPTEKPDTTSTPKVTTSPTKKPTATEAPVKTETPTKAPEKTETTDKTPQKPTANPKQETEE